MTDTDDRPPTLGSCPYCAWEFVFPTVAAKEKGEAKHAERWHGEVTPGTDELCDEMVARHGDEHTEIVRAIEACAVVNHGRVDPNVVRQMLPPGITPQLIGAVYNVLRRSGRLQPIEQGVNNDTHGRNVGKPMTIYRLFGDERSQSA